VNPEFQMQGISFVVSTAAGPAHALPFKLRTNSGKRVEIQHAFHDHYTVVDVVRELRSLANELERTAIEPAAVLDYPGAVAGPTLHSAPVDSKPPLPK
jgi:hypothetical protein